MEEKETRENSPLDFSGCFRTKITTGVIADGRKLIRRIKEFANSYEKSETFAINYWGASLIRYTSKTMPGEIYGKLDTGRDGEINSLKVFTPETEDIANFIAKIKSGISEEEFLQRVEEYSWNYGFVSEEEKRRIVTGHSNIDEWFKILENSKRHFEIVRREIGKIPWYENPFSDEDIPMYSHLLTIYGNNNKVAAKIKRNGSKNELQRLVDKLTE